MNAGHVIRSARSRAGLSLRELARRSGTSHSTLSAYECGRVDPTTSTLDRIIHAAGFRCEVALVPVRTRGDELIEALDLAAMFPARHDDRLRAPIFGRA